LATWEDWQQLVLVVLQDWLADQGRPNGAIGGSNRNLKGTREDVLGKINANGQSRYASSFGRLDGRLHFPS
jgi:hypothetical protein